MARVRTRVMVRARLRNLRTIEPDYANMEKLEVRAVTKYLYIKGMMQKEIFYDMKET